MRASPSLSQLWQPHSGLCHLCRACEQQREAALQASGAKSCMPPKALRCRGSPSAAQVVLRGTFQFSLRTKTGTHYSGRCAWRVPVMAARRGTVYGDVGRVPRFPHISQLTVLPLYVTLSVCGEICLRLVPFHSDTLILKTRPTGLRVAPSALPRASCGHSR